jgi:hypothetical protein
MTEEEPAAGGTHDGERPSPAASSETLIAMVRRLPPTGAPVVPGSPPVVAFGNPQSATVATLGINPSHREFTENGSLLSGNDRRLATLESLSADRLDQLTDEQVARVVADCANYFHRRPYRRWFDPLDRLLQASTGCGYYEGTACHLDLVQWATDPTWTHIADADIRRVLLDDGVPHLTTQLVQDNLRLVLLNGRQVLNQVRATGLTTLTELAPIHRTQDTCRVYTGDGGGVRWVGWSTNLQSSRGVSTAFTQQLAERIAELSEQRPTQHEATRPPGQDPDRTIGYLSRGTRVCGKRELAAVLKAWLRRSQASTIGDVGTFGGRAWLHIEINGQHIMLNADTKRAAVETFVRLSDTNPDQPWRVVANGRGRVNKVLPYPHADPLPGWYAYLSQPLTNEDTI